MPRFQVYSFLSFLAAAGVIGHAVYIRGQFYNVIIHLATSKISVTLLGNAGLVVLLLVAQVMRHLFLGPIRAAEMDRLYEKSWFAITETCLALTIFREEISFRFVFLLTILLFAKVFHWLSQFRVEQFPTELNISIATHARILALMSSLLLFDAAALLWQVKTMMSEGPSILILFTFECILLSSSVVTTFCKYLIYVVDVRRHGRWGGKAVVGFYLNLASDLFQLFVYLCFFAIVFKYYGLPLHIVRDLYMTFGRFKKRIADFVRYRRIIVNMNSKFPTATDEELAAVDCTCVVCRDEMVAESSKKLPCGHIFHLECLRAWLEGNTTCPTCRAAVEPEPHDELHQRPIPRRARIQRRPAPQGAEVQAAQEGMAEREGEGEREREREGERERERERASARRLDSGSAHAPAPAPRAPRTHAEAAAAAAAAAKQAASEAAVLHIRTLLASSQQQQQQQVHTAQAPAPAAAEPPPQTPVPAAAAPTPVAVAPAPTSVAAAPVQTPVVAPAPPGAPPPPNPPAVPTSSSAEPPPPIPPLPRHKGYAAGGTPSHTPSRGTPAGRGGNAAGGTPWGESGSPGGGAGGGWAMVMPEVSSLEPLRQGVGVEVEKAAAELEGCIARTDPGARASLNGLIMRLETLLLPMASSQADYIATVLGGYSASPLSPSNTPVRRLKLTHLLRTLQCQQSEVSELIEMAKQHLAILPHEGGGGLRQRGGGRGAQV